MKHNYEKLQRVTKFKKLTFRDSIINGAFIETVGFFVTKLGHCLYYKSFCAIWNHLKYRVKSKTVKSRMTNALKRIDEAVALLWRQD